MLPERVPARHTPATLEDLRSALMAAWCAQTAAPLASPGMGLLLAHVALETARGQSIWNHNPGNHKAAAGADWTYLTTEEVLEPGKAAAWLAASTPHAPVVRVSDEPDGRVRVRVSADHPAARFAAFRSLAGGCAYHLERLRARWPGAWLALVDGDVARYARALSDGPCKYFTADPVTYARELAHLADALDEGRVRATQARLAALGYDPGPVDGKLGPRTRAALERFQVEHALPPSGALTSGTLGALGLSA